MKYAKVFPFSQLLGVKVPAKWYRKVIGSFEIICGLMLAFIPKSKSIIFLLLFDLKITNTLLFIKININLFTFFQLWLRELLM